MEAGPERREATLLFADLGNYTEWNARADPEDVALVMDAIKEGAAQIVGVHGGFVNQFVGDEVMAVFGLPVAHDDDPSRAVGAALELHELLRSERIRSLVGHDHALTFHTGIDCGVVLAQRRDIRDGVFDLTGSAVNQAARLRGVAGPDQIVVSEHVNTRVSGYFESRALPPQHLKGVPGPVIPYEITGRTAARSAFEVALARGLTRYVGRERERAALVEFLGDAQRGDARLVAVAGPPGVGKTRLMHELVEQARARGFTVLRGQCQSYGHIPPFQPFLETLADALGVNAHTTDLARQVIDSARELGPEVEAHTAIYLYLLSPTTRSHPLPPDMTGQTLRRAVIDALGDILVAHSRLHPVLVIVEDWHWADEASDALFRELARRTVGTRIMAAVTHRQELLSARRRPLSNRQVELGHFDRDGTRALLGNLLACDALPPGLCEFVHEATDGNPFFVEEVCQSLLDSGALLKRGAAVTLERSPSELEPPSTVQAMVRARIDRLSAEDRELLKLASVIGTVFSIDLLAALRGEDAALSGMLERLEARAHILNLDPVSYRFKHAIVQEVAYNVLLLRRRRQLHGRLAQAIETRFGDRGLEPHYEALAHHFAHSEFGDKAVDYAELAGRKAERSASLEQARAHYLRGVQRLDELAPTPERKRRRVDLSLRWASLLVHDPSGGQLQILLRSLDYATELGYQLGVARTLSWMGWIEYTLGNQPRAIEWNERCLKLLGDHAAEFDEPALLAQVRANIGMSLVMCCDYERAQPYLAELYSLKGALFGLPSTGDAGQVVGQAGFGYAISHMAIIAGDRGRFDEASRYMSEAFAVVEASGRVALLGALHTIEGMIAVFRDDLAQCEKSAAAVREIAERIDGAYQRQMAETLEGYARVHARGDRSGIEQLRAAALFLERRGIGLTLSWNFACLAEALLWAGELDEALAHAESALARSAFGDALGRAHALRVRAAVLAQKGMDAEPDCRASLEIAADKASPREEALALMCWAQHTADAARRRERASRASTLFEALDMANQAAKARALSS